MTQGIDAPAVSASSGKLNWASLWKKLGPFIGLLFVFGLFAVLRPKTFLSTVNLQIMLLQTAVVGTGALGMTIIIISAGIDLSVGSVVALSTVTIALLLNAGVPQILAAAGGTAIGVAAGFVTGNLVIGQIGRVLSVILCVSVAAWLASTDLSIALIWIFSLAALAAGLTANELLLRDLEFNARLGLIPFIATLGMMGALRGVAHWLGENGTIVVIGNKFWLKHLLIILGPDNAWMIFPPASG